MIPLRDDDWARYIKSGDRIFFGSFGGCPHTLIGKFLEQSHRFSDIEIVHLLTLGDAPWTAPEYSDSLRLNSFFLGPNTRDVVNAGGADFSPCYLSEIPKIFADKTLPVDVAFVMVSPPDAQGYCSLGVSVDISLGAVRSARKVIAQINPRMPRTFGESFVHVNEIDAFLEASEELQESPRIEAHSRAAALVGRYCSLLVEDGACIQAGIGRVPNAVLRALRNRNDLGVHTETVGDGIMELIKNGNVTNARKVLNRGKTVGTFALGTRALYDFIHENPHVELHPSDYTNSPLVIARNPGHVSINSALEVDLTGQVASDSIGMRFYSGIGGQVDFIRGAGMSAGGRPIIALESTAKGGTVSRIAANLSAGSGVVTTRGDVHYIVTEYGIATMRGRSVRERALELIRIAHPKFRDELLDRARERGLVPKAAPSVKQVPELDDAGDTERIVIGELKLFLRPLRTSDHRRLQEFFYSHNEDTLLQRYRTIPRAMTVTRAYQMVGVDQTKDLALGIFSRQGPREVIHGVGRFYRDGDEAEVAFVTGESVRGRGIGTLLCTRLIQVAAARGIRRLKAYVRTDNGAMRHMLEKRGFVFSPDPEDPGEAVGVLEIAKTEAHA